MQILRYIIWATLCLSLFYLAFLMLFRNDKNFKQLRIFLLISVLCSLLIPLSKYRIRTDLFMNRHPSTTLVYHSTAITQVTEKITEIKEEGNLQPWLHNLSGKDVLSLMIWVYYGVACFLLMKMIIQLTLICLQYFNSEKTVQKDYVLLYNHRYRSIFSFFRWIFIPSEPFFQNDIEIIIAHEKIHVAQMHSLDLLVVELLTAVMWFNPLIWMMKNSMQLVHEYLADEGALATGIDKLSYQTLLINHVSEEKIICISSSFSHSLKKRMMMMKTNKINQGTKLKNMALIPVSAFLFLSFSFINGISQDTHGKYINLKESGGSVLSSSDTLKVVTLVKVVDQKHPGDSVFLRTETHEIYNSDGKTVHYATCSGVDSTGDKNSHRYAVEINSEGTITHSIENEKPQETQDIHKNTLDHTLQIRLDKTDDYSSNPLVIIDGVRHPEQGAISRLDPNTIDRVEVFIDPESVKKYSPEKYSHVIIVTKKSNKETK
jgi:beta-lactamase regulating signal transducer with metallopeptidase domain